MATSEIDNPIQIQPKHSLRQIQDRLPSLLNNPKQLAELAVDVLEAICIHASQTYRKGKPIVEDDFYDHFLLPELAKRIPNHPLIEEVEDDYQSFGVQKIALPEPMLSTQKAYEIRQLELFLERIQKKASELNCDVNELRFKITVKLDGFAAYYDGERLITRGNGFKGTDISRALERGLWVYQNPHSQNQVTTGAGEIVVQKSYFNQNLIQDFIHPRNFVASVIKEKELDQKTQKAVEKKAAMFFPFAQLDAFHTNAAELIAKLDLAHDELTEGLDFEYDGLVIELDSKDAIHRRIKAELGQTFHHHRWQIAYKKNTEKAKSTILDVFPQTGRTGQITPVATISPVKLSGATISRVSAHNYDLIQKLEIGKGAKVEIVRSGEVIPKITAVLKPAAEIKLPETCPSCHESLIWQTKFLVCQNHEFCPDQIQGSLIYFFQKLDNLDGFGPATIKIFYEFGVRKVSEIYQLTEQDLAKMGYLTKTRNNLLSALRQSLSEPLEDWRFLTAFGIDRLGQATCIKLLENFTLAEIFELKLDDLIQIDGFAAITAKSILAGIELKKAEIQKLIPQFNLQYTEKNQLAKQDLPLQDLQICFTGKMLKDRNQMQADARALGAKVMDSISNQTNLLVVGENAGASKLEKARLLNIKVMSEMEYLTHLSQLDSSS